MLIPTISSLVLASFVKTYVSYEQAKRKNAIEIHTLNIEKEELVNKLNISAEQLLVQKAELAQLFIKKTDAVNHDWFSSILPKILIIGIVGCGLITLFNYAPSLSELTLSLKEGILKSSGIVQKSQLIVGKDSSDNEITIKIISWTEDSCLSVFFGESQELVDIGALLNMKKYLLRLEPAAKQLQVRLEEEVLKSDQLIHSGGQLKVVIEDLEVDLNQKGEEILGLLQTIDSLNVKLTLLEDQLKEAEVHPINSDVIDAFKEILLS